jgi:hypothetical protein
MRVLEDQLGLRPAPDPACPHRHRAVRSHAARRRRRKRGWGQVGSAVALLAAPPSPGAGHGWNGKRRHPTVATGTQDVVEARDLTAGRNARPSDASAHQPPRRRTAWPRALAPSQGTKVTSKACRAQPSREGAAALHGVSQHAWGIRAACELRAAFAGLLRLRFGASSRLTCWPVRLDGPTTTPRSTKPRMVLLRALRRAVVRLADTLSSRRDRTASSSMVP